MEIEEKIFYPHIKDKTKEDDLMNKAVVEHAGAKDLVKQLETLKIDDPMFDAKIKILSEQIDHHVQEEEKEMFFDAQQKDLEKLGQELFAARNKTRAEHGLAAVPNH